MPSSPAGIVAGLWPPTVEQVDTVLRTARLPVTDSSRMIFQNEIVRLRYKWWLWDSEIPALNKRVVERHQQIQSCELRNGVKSKLRFRQRRNEFENYICYQLYRLFAEISHTPPRNSTSLYKFTTEAVTLLGFKWYGAKVGFKAAVGFMTPDAFRMRIKRLLSENESQRLLDIAGWTIPAWASRFYESPPGVPYEPPGTPGLLIPDMMFGNLGLVAGRTYKWVVDQETG